MIFNNIKKYLLVFPALLLVVGNIGFCSNELFNSNDTNDIKAKDSINNITDNSNTDVIQEINKIKMELNTEIYKTISEINYNIKQCYRNNI